MTGGRCSWSRAARTDGRATNYPRQGWTITAPKNNNGKYPEVSHWIVCKGQSPKPPKTVKVVFEKKWKGDAEGSARFFIDGEGPFQPGEAVDVTALAGKRVRITEEVTGLPEGCTWKSDLPSKVDLPTRGQEDRGPQGHLSTVPT